MNRLMAGLAITCLAVAFAPTALADAAAGR